MLSFNTLDKTRAWAKQHIYKHGKCILKLGTA